MGTGGWIIIAIIVIQAIAGGVSKIVEARKAGGEKVLKPGASRPVPTPSASTSTRAKLDALRQQRVAAMRAPVHASAPAPAPAPTPVRISASAAEARPPTPSRPKNNEPIRKAAPVKISAAIANSAIFDGAIRASQISTQVGTSGASTSRAESIIAMLASGERFQDAVLFAEILAPPLSLRPEKFGGHRNS